MKTFKPQKKRTLNMEWEGEEIHIRFPKTSELVAYRKEVNEHENDESLVIESMFIFLEKLGLKKEVADELDHIDLIEIMKILGGAEVKK